jgi:PAS domain S-box-containing protein
LDGCATIESATILSSPDPTALQPDAQILFEAMPGLFLVVLPVGLDFTVIAATRECLQALHLSSHEVIGRTVSEVLTRVPNASTGLPQLISSFQRVVETRQPDSLDFTAGESVVSCLNTPALDSNGQVRFIIHELRESSTLSPSPAQQPEATFSIAFAEAPVGMVLSGPDGTIVEVNQAFLDMLGYTREELSLRDSSHITHPDDVARTRQFLTTLRDTGESRACIEKRYIHRSGITIWARVYATLRRNDGGAPTQVIATVEDITERKRAEERLRATYDSTYEYIGLLAPDGTILDCNRASLEFADIKREQVVGRPFWESAWFIHTPGAPDKLREAIARAAAGEFIRYEVPLRKPNGEVMVFDFSIHPIKDECGEVTMLIPEGRDITALKHVERRDAFLVRLDDTTRPLTDPYEITQTAARLLGEHLDVNRCAYADVEADEDTFNLTGDYNFNVPSIVGRYTFTQFGAECLRLMREGRPYIVEDSETDPRIDSAVLESYRLTLIRSVICVSLLKAGKFVAAMAVHQATPRQWRNDEVELVQLVANRCWESIERVHVTREVREREQRFRFLAECIPQMVWTATPDGMIDYVNAQAQMYIGVVEDALLGSDWRDWIHPDDRAVASERWQSSVSSGKPFEASLRLKRHIDNSWRWHLSRALPFLKNGNVVQWFGTSTDIEDQKQAETNLQQQWQTFDTALSHTPDFAYVFDLQGRLRYANRSLLALWQIPLEEAIGKSLLDLGFPEDVAGKLQHDVEQVIESGLSIRDRTAHRSRTEGTRHYEYIFVPVFDTAGRIEAVAGSTRDITEQTEIAQRIEEDRRRWRELLLQSPAAIAILRGPDHVFEWANNEYLRFIERPLHSLLGKPVLYVLPETGGQPYIDLLDRVYRSGESATGDEHLIQLQRQNGDLEDLYVNFVYAPTRDVSGAIDGVFAHIVDVTDTVLARKQAEQSEGQFRTLAESIPHLAWMADETGYVLWYNRRWYDYTGTTFEDMKGRGWELVQDPAVLPEVRRTWETSLNTGQSFEMVFPIKGADGTFRSFLSRGEPVFDSSGRIVRWLGTNTDITTQRKIEEELRRMNRELEEFAYVASHDLQEPLRMVNIYTDLILRNIEGSDGRLRQYSDYVHEGVRRMEALLHDLLTFSRTVHTEEAPKTTANLTESLNEALAVLKNRIEESGAKVVAPAALPVVLGEASQIAHVFQNVLSNALKYRKPDFPPEIHIDFALRDGQCTVSVRDNGIGFQPRYAERIFGLFKRLHKDSYPGTGLGLAICKRIVERYGGRMWAQGEPDVGAVFFFTLPATTDTPPPAHNDTA